MPSHYVNQCCNIVNSNLRNKRQWNPKWNSNIFFYRRNCIWKCLLQNGSHFCFSLDVLKIVISCNNIFARRKRPISTEEVWHNHDSAISYWPKIEESDKKSHTLTNCDIDRLVQEKRNSTANAMELRFSCTNPSICTHIVDQMGQHSIFFTILDIAGSRVDPCGGPYWCWLTI